MVAIKTIFANRVSRTIRCGNRALPGCKAVKSEGRRLGATPNKNPLHSASRSTDSNFLSLLRLRFFDKSLRQSVSLRSRPEFRKFRSVASANVTVVPLRARNFRYFYSITRPPAARRGVSRLNFKRNSNYV